MRITFGLALPLLALTAFLAGCASTPSVPVSTGPLTGDEKRLQGSWVVVHNELKRTILPEMHGRIHIYEGRRFRLDTDKGSEAFRIDEHRSPKQIDFDDGRLPLIQGIYKLNGDRLTVCTGAPGASRPTDFATSFGSGTVLTILVRQPSAR
jgi:uncharacterized protein (TIGR03067 family)